MKENTPPNISTIFVLKQGSRGSSQSPKNLRKMGLQRGKTKLSSRKPKR
jgi:hypothetical protein